MPFETLAQLANEKKIRFEEPDVAAAFELITPGIPKHDPRRVVNWTFTHESPSKPWKEQHILALTYFEDPHAKPHVRFILDHGILAPDGRQHPIFETKKIQGRQSFHLVFEDGQPRPILSLKRIAFFKPSHENPKKFVIGHQEIESIGPFEINQIKGLLRRLAQQPGHILPGSKESENHARIERARNYIQQWLTNI